MGMGPTCWTSLSTGLSEWELGPGHAEQSPIAELQNLRFKLASHETLMWAVGAFSLRVLPELGNVCKTG